MAVSNLLSILPNLPYKLLKTYSSSINYSDEWKQRYFKWLTLEKYRDLFCSVRSAIRTSNQTQKAINYLKSTPNVNDSGIKNLVHQVIQIIDCIEASPLSQKATYRHKKNYRNLLKTARKTVRYRTKLKNKKELSIIDKKILKACEKILKKITSSYFFSSNLSDLEHTYMKASRKLASLENKKKYPVVLDSGHLVKSLTKKNYFMQGCKKFISRTAKVAVESATGLGLDCLKRITPGLVCILELPEKDGTVHRVKYLRTPSPTVTNPARARTQISPLFKFYIENSLKQNQSHIYFNLQKRESFIDGEKERCRVLENFEKKLLQKALQQKTKTKFYLLTFPHNSNFYEQKGKMFNSDTYNSEEFINLFTSLLKTNKEGFYIGESFKDFLSQEKIKEILESVLKLYFDNKTILTLQERKTFIDLAYTEIMEACILHVKPTSINSSCKSDKDRGGTRRLLTLTKMLLANPPQSKRKLRAKLNHLFTHYVTTPMLAGKSPLNKIVKRSYSCIEAYEKAYVNQAFRKNSIKVRFPKTALVR